MDLSLYASSIKLYLKIPLSLTSNMFPWQDVRYIFLKVWSPSRGPSECSCLSGIVRSIDELRLRVGAIYGFSRSSIWISFSRAGLETRAIDFSSGLEMSFLREGHGSLSPFSVLADGLEPVMLTRLVAR